MSADPPMGKPDWWGDEPFTQEGARARLRRLAAPYNVDRRAQLRARAGYYAANWRRLKLWASLPQWVRDSWVSEAAAPFVFSRRVRILGHSFTVTYWGRSHG
jgi:hypothetical protein